MRWTLRFGVMTSVVCTVSASPAALAQVRRSDTRARPKTEVIITNIDAIKSAPAEARLDLKRAFLEQCSQQLRPILNAEYQFIRSACAMTEEQRKKVASDGERVLRRSAQRFVEVRRNGLSAANPPDPRRWIEEGLSVSVKAHLSPEQTARYEAEIQKRDDDRKRIAILNTVALIDQWVVLTADQRERLIRTLSLNWQRAWCPTLEIFQHINAPPDAVSDEYIASVLDDDQLKTWKRVLTRSAVFWNGDSFMANLLAGDNPLEDEALRAAQKSRWDTEERK
jgi:hypothetical protein